MSDNAKPTRTDQGDRRELERAGQEDRRALAKQNEKEGVKPMRPPVDVIEGVNGVTVFADMPGVSKDSLSLNLDREHLTIEGEMHMDLPEDMESRFAEVSVPRYQRTFTLSRDLDGEKAKAELKNGVLKLYIPKAAHAQPRRIQISTG